MLHPENPKPVDSPFRDFVKAEKGVSKKPGLNFAIHPLVTQWSLGVSLHQGDMGG